METKMRSTQSLKDAFRRILEGVPIYSGYIVLSAQELGGYTQGVGTGRRVAEIRVESYRITDVTHFDKANKGERQAILDIKRELLV